MSIYDGIKLGLGIIIANYLFNIVYALITRLGH